MNKRIAMLLPDLGGGGAERVFLTLANSFARKGIHVDLVLMKKIGPYLQDLPNNIHLVSLCPGTGKVMRISEVLISFFNLIKYLNQTKMDVLFSTLTRTNIFSLMAHKLSRNKCRIVIREANTLHNVRNALLRRLMAVLYPTADHIIAISKGVGEDLLGFRGIDPEKIRVIYNPVDIEKIGDLSRKQNDHHWLNDKQVPVIVAVGRLSLQKDFETLIDAFYLVQQKKDCRLMILGDGPLKEGLERKIRKIKLSSKVQLIGFQMNPFTYIHHADLFVLSSRWEGFGMVIIEALACGTNIVSTDCHSGPSEILGNGRYGRLTPVGNAVSLSEAIFEALMDPLPSKELSRRADAFSIEKISRLYMESLWPEKLVR